MKKVLTFLALLVPIAIFSQEEKRESVSDLETATLAPSNLFDLQFPTDAAILQELWIPKNLDRSSQQKVILHVQDVHCHYEAQTHIAKLLEKIMKRYGVHLVAVEGTAGPIDTSPLSEFKDAEAKEKVTQYFMRKGKITGPEYLSIMKKYPFTLFGIENEDLYDANVRAFKKLLPFREKSQIICNTLEEALNTLKGHLYSKRLMEMDTHIHLYHSDKLPLTEFCKILKAEFERIYGEAKAQEILREKYPQYFHLLKSTQFEEKLNPPAQQVEQQRLFQKLSQSLSQDEIAKLVSAGLQVRLGRMSQTRYYLDLNEALSTLPEWKKEFPEIARVIEYAEVYESIDQKKAFEEIDGLTQEILGKLFESEDQRKLFNLSKNLSLLRKLFLLELSREDLAYYRAHTEEFKSKTYLEFIEEKTKNIPIPNLESLHQLPLDELDNYQPYTENFYRLANQRDETLVDNTLKVMEEMESPVAFMVTGGYHTPGIKEILKTRGIAYAILAPKVTKEEPNNPYVEILKGQKSTLEDFLTQESD